MFLFGVLVLRVAGAVAMREEVMDVLPEDLSYLVSDLRPFTDYTFRVTASTIVGEGPAADVTEKTREQGWTATQQKMAFIFYGFVLILFMHLFIFSPELGA